MSALSNRSRFAMFIAGAFAIFALAASTVHADTTPVITSFTISPTSINNDYSIVFTWTASNSTGHDLLVQCPDGVTLKKQDGTVFPCNTRQSISQNASASVGFTVTNVSGSTKNIYSTVYPKDASGADYDAGSMTASFSVGTSPQPITGITVSSTTPASGASVTLSWTGVDVGGTNVQFDCANGVQITATSPAVTNALPCGALAFTSDQPTSGSVSFTPVNSTLFPVTVTVRVLPSITPGVHDATHALSATFAVAGMVPTPNPSVLSFTGSLTSVPSGTPFDLGWNTQNATNVNIQLPCSDSLTFLSVVGTTTSGLPCNIPAYATPLGTSGTTTIEVVNSSYSQQTFSVMLLPMNSSGIYLGSASRSLSFTVLPKGVSAPVFQNTSAPQVTTPAASSTAPATSKQFTFTLALHQGSKNIEVKNLQTFLSENSTIYPEGTVTGYFGPATLRAVQRLQVKYSIAKLGDSGYGLVGPKTRALLNSLQTP